MIKAGIKIILDDNDNLIITNLDGDEILMVRENVTHWDWFELWNDFNKYGKYKGD